MKDMRYVRRHGLKIRIKKKAAIGPRRGISQENQHQILNLKSQKGRGRVVGEFCMAHTTSVVLNNSKSKDERKKRNVSLEEN